MKPCLWFLALACLALSVPSGAAAAQAEGDTLVFDSYPKMRAAIGDLYQQERFREAAAILAEAIPRFPDHVLANTYNLAAVHVRLGHWDEAVRALAEGHARGVFYNKWEFEGAFWDSLRAAAGFAAEQGRNDELIAAAQRKSVMKVEVATPEGYEAGRAVPLFIALHGGGQNLGQFRPMWTSPRLRRDFLVAYVQSSQVASMDGFHWQDEATTRREIEAAYREVLSTYSVDAERVVVGGFSSGGFGALVAYFAETVPAAGFVVLCPVPPENPPRELVLAAARRGGWGTLLTTELDGRRERQGEYAAYLNGQGLDVRFHVVPVLGHGIPDNLEQLLDDALERVGPRP